MNPGVLFQRLELAMPSSRQKCTRTYRDNLVIRAPDLPIVTLLQLAVSGAISLVPMALMVLPCGGAKYHQFRVIIVVAMTENLHGAVIAVGDILPQFLAQGLDCLIIECQCKSAPRPVC